MQFPDSHPSTVPQLELQCFFLGYQCSLPFFPYFYLIDVQIEREGGCTQGEILATLLHLGARGSNPGPRTW